ncbi:MAG: hypothetical protein JO019_03525 [Candidatus Kaiserbacteria bacterium]|nr:hypothetical protein [Candidatus Kaiserbacteria bacterium]
MAGPNKLRVGYCICLTTMPAAPDDPGKGDLFLVREISATEVCGLLMRSGKIASLVIEFDRAWVTAEGIEDMFSTVNFPISIEQARGFVDATRQMLRATKPDELPAFERAAASFLRELATVAHVSP